jgi:transcriptional regulator with XRE-family HTH domain
VGQLLRDQERSQAWLARKIELDPSLLSHYLSGRRKAPIDLVDRMAAVLGVPVDEIQPREEVAA